MRKEILLIFFATFVFLSAAPVTAQVTLNAKVIKASGETFTIDSGKNNGLVEGLEGKVSYTETLEGKDVRIDIAFAKIMSVGASSSELKVIQKTDSIQTGYSVILKAQKISISGTPAKARVIIDNQQIGIAPISNRLIAPGNHQVTVRLDDYDQYSKAVTVSDNSPAKVEYELTPKFGMISIEGRPPGAMAYVDGKKIGKTPVSKRKISPGNHTLKIVTMGYENYEEKFSTQKAKTTELAPILIPKTRKKALKKSLVFPGSGQRYADHKGKGTLITVLQLTTICGVVGTTVMANSAISEYDSAVEKYKEADDSLQEIKNASEDAQDKYNVASKANTLQKVAIGATLAVYLWNVIDVAVSPKKLKLSDSGNAISIKAAMLKNYFSIHVSVRF